MSITAQQVKELRERSGAGMMECKKALVETNGDIEAAIEHLRKSGLAKADKKASRVAAEGLIIQAENDQKVALIEINCETDFVTKDDSFKTFTNEVSEAALSADVNDIATLLAQPLVNGQSVEQARQTLIARVGENIQVRRYAQIEKAGLTVKAYIHGDRIGVITALAGDDAELAYDIAMHIAAFSPAYISDDDVPANIIAKEKEILVAQASDSGKPADIIEKMVVGRLRKQLAEITLYGQPFVKDNDISVGQLLQQKSASVKTFVRLAVGEGIEKEESDFAAEVMQQVKASDTSATA